MKLKKIATILLSAMLSIGVLAGCSNNSSNSSICPLLADEIRFHKKYSPEAQKKNISFCRDGKTKRRYPQASPLRCLIFQSISARAFFRFLAI